ncbi:MAG: GNAT family N-acetyltransferase [Peptostreptococcaceae bacterium]
MLIKAISPENRNEANEFIISKWNSTNIAIRGRIFDTSTMDGFILYETNTIIGLVTYRIDEYECEIMTLDSIKENQGYGTILLNKVIEAASYTECTKVKLITTNDNVNAFAFYQKRGFDLVCVYPYTVEYARRLKPSIPMFGDNNIPIKHELEFEIKL